MTKPINTGSISNLPPDLLRQVKQHLLNLPPTDHVKTVSGFVIAALEEKLRRDWIRQTP
jgi:hypothetical protein